MIKCSKCRTIQPARNFNIGRLAACPKCGTRLLIEVFPRLFDQIPAAVSSPPAMTEEAGCYYHPKQKAVIFCESCGRFLCSLCHLEIVGRHICPGCLETEWKKGRIRNLETHRTLYDSAALTLAVLPMIFFYWPTLVTAPLVFYLSLRYWKAPSSIIGRNTRLRFIVAMLLAGIQMTSWSYFLYILII